MSIPVELNTPVAISIKQQWIGRVLSGLAVLFLLFDAIGKLLRPDAVIQGTSDLGWPVSALLTLGVIQVICLLAYLVPRTSVLGAILWTGYLGGAVATHLRLGNPLFSHILFPTYLGALLWGGLWFRDRRLRDLLPLRRTN
ncbi:MAG TPA: DoxX family protein [Thermoanaerobaculia bacterium]|nr:DoxX family protein [Thermoanaerobaculia bacterium]